MYSSVYRTYKNTYFQNGGELKNQTPKKVNVKVPNKLDDDLLKRLQAHNKRSKKEMYRGRGKGLRQNTKSSKSSSSSKKRRPRKPLDAKQRKRLKEAMKIAERGRRRSRRRSNKRLKEAMKIADKGRRRRRSSSRSSSSRSRRSSRSTRSSSSRPSRSSTSPSRRRRSVSSSTKSSSPKSVQSGGKGRRRRRRRYRACKGLKGNERKECKKKINVKRSNKKIMKYDARLQQISNLNTDNLSDDEKKYLVYYKLFITLKKAYHEQILKKLASKDKAEKKEISHEIGRIKNKYKEIKRNNNELRKRYKFKNGQVVPRNKSAKAQRGGWY